MHVDIYNIYVRIHALAHPFDYLRRTSTAIMTAVLCFHPLDGGDLAPPGITGSEQGIREYFYGDYIGFSLFPH